MEMHDNTNIYNNDIEIDLNTLYDGIILLNSVNSSSEELLTAFSKINLEGSILTTAHILSDIKSELEAMISKELTELNRNVHAVKNKLIEYDVNAALLFSDVDSNYQECFDGYINFSVSFNLYDSLVETFGEKNITELDDGSGYKVECNPTSKAGMVYFFSNDCQEKDIKLFTYIPGINNDSGDQLIEKLEGGVPSGFVGIFANYHNNDKYLNEADEILQKNNIHVEKVLLSCFSGGGPIGPKVLAGYVEKHPEIKEKSLACVDAKINKVSDYTEEIYGVLKENNVSIYCISGSPDTYGYFGTNGVAENLEDSGYNVTKIYDHTMGTGEKGHKGYNKNFLLGDVWKYILGINNTYDKEMCHYEILN